MSHLLQEYAKSCGVKIGDPVFNPLFYPIQFEKYIVLHHSTCNATTYDHWNILLTILKPYIEKQNIKVVQILDKNSAIINLADKHIQCSKKQAAFIISKCLCFVGTDSVFSNIAGQFNVPSINLYSHTNPQNTKPWVFNKKSVFISSLTNEKKPSYDPNENPKTINNIFPEEIIKNILNILNIKRKLKFKTIFIGSRYNENCVDIIPKENSNIIHDNINVRMDIHHDEEVLKNILFKNFAEVTLLKPISKEIISMKKIKIINYLAEEFDKDFIEIMKNSGVKFNLLCVSEEKLSQQRFLFFDDKIIFHDLKTILKNNFEKLKNASKSNLKTISSKIIMIGDKKYSSYLEAINSKELFFLDLDMLLVYTDEV